MVTSALHDAKKQGLLGFVMHVLCGGERAVCNARLFYGIWQVIKMYDRCWTSATLFYMRTCT